jgi:hypothetical protein
VKFGSGKPRLGPGPKGGKREKPMNEEIKKTIDSVLEKAGLNAGRLVVGTYETQRKGTVGLYFHYRWTQELANGLVKLAMEDQTVYESIKELRRSFDLILESVEGAKVIEKKGSVH